MGTADTSDRGVPREPTVAELRAFVAVAEELHFRRAAARLGIAAPPLSQAIRRLEDKVGSVLLERTPRTVRLTQAGDELLPRARDILQRMAEAQLAVRGAGTLEHRGPFTVGIMSNGFAELTGPILEAFTRAHPRARLRLVEVTSEPGAGLPAGAVDVALMRPPVVDGDNPLIESEVVVLERRASLLPRRHRLSEAPAVSIMDLADDTFVATGPPDIRDYWAAADARGGAPVRYGAEAWSVPDVLRGVGYLGDVITSFPSILRFFSVPGVAAVPLTDVAPAPMAMLSLRDDHRPIVEDFRRTVRSVSAAMIDLVPHATLARA